MDLFKMMGQFKDMQSRMQTMQDEMKQRDVMTSNRDKRIWAVAKGGDLTVADDNLPPVRLLPSSNKPDVKPFLSGEEAIKHMTVPKGAKYDAIVLAVAHNEFKEMGAAALHKLGKKNHVLYDIKQLLPANETDGRL